MRSPISWLIVAAVTVVLAHPAGAVTLGVGARIRWASPDEPLRTGTVVALAVDTLVATGERDSVRVSLPLSSLNRLEISRGQPNRAARYAMIGALGGAVTALGAVWILDAVVDKALSEWFDSSTTDSGTYVRAGLVGAGIGAAGGVIVGATRHGDERWEPVHLPGAHFGLGLRLGAGPELRLTVRY